tara:strand:- start:3 stop:710 length:708 start_codon:yes stop_codon:yes gene_type:complete
MTQIAFLVPATTNRRDWKDYTETDLYMFLLKSLEDHPPDGVEITMLIGYDADDTMYSVAENRMKFNAVFDNIILKWYEYDASYKGKPTWIWNSLGDIAINQGFEWMKVLGSDILTPKDKGWVGKMINDLKKTKKIGIAGGDSGNPNLPMTQFLIHKTHIQTFGWIFPPQIHAWFCDDWLQEIYPKKFVHYSPMLKLSNVGGAPRYDPKNDRQLCDMLLKRHKPAVNRLINKLSSQ